MQTWQLVYYHRIGNQTVEIWGVLPIETIPLNSSRKGTQNINAITNPP